MSGRHIPRDSQAMRGSHDDVYAAPATCRAIVSQSFLASAALNAGSHWCCNCLRPCERGFQHAGRPARCRSFAEDLPRPTALFRSSVTVCRWVRYVRVQLRTYAQREKRKKEKSTPLGVIAGASVSRGSPGLLPSKQQPTRTYAQRGKEALIPLPNQMSIPLLLDSLWS